MASPFTYLEWQLRGILEAVNELSTGRCGAGVPDVQPQKSERDIDTSASTRPPWGRPQGRLAKPRAPAPPPSPRQGHIATGRFRRVVQAILVLSATPKTADTPRCPPVTRLWPWRGHSGVGSGSFIWPTPDEPIHVEWDKQGQLRAESGVSAFNRNRPPWSSHACTPIRPCTRLASSSYRLQQSASRPVTGAPIHYCLKLHRLPKGRLPSCPMATAT